MADMYDEYDDEETAPAEDQSALTQAYLNTSLQRKNEAKAQMDKLIRALDARRNMPFDPMLMRVAGALLQPTKTGSAGESIGYAASAAADEAEKQALRGVDIAKMEFELGEKMRQQQQGVDALQLAMAYEQGTLPPGTPNLGAPPAPAAAQPAGALPQAEPQADRSGEIAMGAAPTTEMPPATEVPVAAPSAAPAPPAPETPLGALPPARRRPSAITPGGAVGFALKTGAPEYYAFRKEQEELNLRRRDLEQKGYKPITIDGNTVLLSPGQLRRFTNMQNKGDAEGINKFYKNLGLSSPFVKEEDGTYRVKTSAEKEREKALAGGIDQKDFQTVYGPFKLTPEQYANFIKINEADPEMGRAYLAKFAPSEKGAVSGERPKLITTDVQKQTEAKQTEVMKEDVKQSAELATLSQKRANEAAELKQAIDDLSSIAKSNPKVFGLLQGPGYVKAIARAVDEGSNSVKLGKIAEGKLSREDLLALQDAANAEARMRNIIRKAARVPGEGATSDLETRMQAALALTTSMSPEIVRIRGEVMRERAMYDEKVFELWSKFKKEKQGYFQEFVNESNEFKNLKKNYESRLENIRRDNAKFFGGSSKAPASKAAPSDEAPASGGALKRWTR
jgi:hypothetical protein